MSWYMWQEYVPVAVRRRRAEQKLKKLAKKGQPVSPVKIEGRTIATSFWGKSWCSNLERYSDYENRLPRGRSYVRNGSVVDLRISKGEIKAYVSGSSLYSVTIGISPVTTKRWQSICKDCAGSIDSLIELLQGRFAKAVMDRVCREGDGLFPAPNEIKLTCSCPDWADMCKHVAAALYGVGARLDREPRLLFVLRGVDENDLLARAGSDLPMASATPASAQVLAEDDVAALFGLEMADAASPAPAIRTRGKRNAAAEKRAKKARAGTHVGGAKDGKKVKSGARHAARDKRNGSAATVRTPRAAATGAMSANDATRHPPRSSRSRSPRAQVVHTPAYSAK
jgi:uncharacterized Zn finger protein